MKHEHLKEIENPALAEKKNELFDEEADMTEEKFEIIIFLSTVCSLILAPLSLSRPYFGLDNVNH